MIKKLFIVLVVALLAWGGWTYFVKGREVCTVTMKSGEIKEQKARDIREIYKKDGYNWGFYKGSQITATGKITKIDPGMATFRIDPDYNKAYYTVTIGKGMKLLVVKEQLDGLAVGDEVIFNGLLADGIDTDYLYISGVDVENCLTLATEAETSIPT